MKTKLLATLLLLSTASISIATAATTIANGNWNTPATWDPAAIPTGTEEVFINDGFTVNVTGGYAATSGPLTIGTNGFGGLNINGGSVNFTPTANYYFGNGTDNEANIYIDGATSSLTSTGSSILYLGFNKSVARLTLANGAKFTASAAIYAGNASNTEGTGAFISVTGGANLTSTSQIWVGGNTGNATLLASGAGSTVKSAGSSWGFVVGSGNGTGYATIDNGAYLTSTFFNIGTNGTSSNGTLIINGTNTSALWSGTGGPSVIGNFSGTGRLDITNGANITGSSMTVGNSSGNGTLNVRDANSKLTINSTSNAFIIGNNSGIGVVNVGNQAAASAVLARIGYNEGTGTLNVSGNASFNYTSTSIGLEIGNGVNTSGTLNITSGGRVAGTFAIAGVNDGTAAIIIDGTDSSFTINNSSKGFTLTNGTIDVKNNGLFTTSSSTANFTMLLGVNGTTTINLTDGGTIRALGAVVLGNGSNGNLTLNINNGILTSTNTSNGVVAALDAGSTAAVNITNGGNLTVATFNAGRAEIEVSGTNSIFAATATNGITLATGNINVSGGGNINVTASSGNPVTKIGYGGTATLYLKNGGNISSTTASLGFGSGAGSIGTLDVSNGVLNTRDILLGMTADAQGIFNLSGGEVFAGNLQVGYRSSVDTTNGTFTMTGGNITLTSSLLLGAPTGTNSAGGTATITGGIAKFNAIYIGGDDDSASPPALLAIGANASITVDTSITLRKTGTIQFNVDRGTFNAFNVTTTGTFTAGAQFTADLTGFNLDLTLDNPTLTLTLASFGTLPSVSGVGNLEDFFGIDNGAGGTDYNVTGYDTAKYKVDFFGFEGANIKITIRDLAPIPEPSTYAALAAIAILAVTLARRRKS